MSVPVAPYPCPVSCLGGQPGSIHIPQVTVNATGPIVTLVNMAQVLKLHCQLQSLAKTGTSPTLDVKLQESLDNGATWSDVSGATFTQLTGAGVPHVDALVEDRKSVV